MQRDTDGTRRALHVSYTYGPARLNAGGGGNNVPSRTAATFPIAHGPAVIVTAVEVTRR